VLNSGDRLHFIAGGHRVDPQDPRSLVHLQFGDGAWLHIEEADRSIWASLFQEITAIDVSTPGPASERVFSIPDLRHDPRTSKLSVVSKSTHFSFFAGVPLTSKNGHNVGAICVVNGTGRPPLSASEADFLTDTAQRCIDLFELARERGFHNRWTGMQGELDNFLTSRSLHAQLLEEPQTSIGRRSSTMKKDVERTAELKAGHVDAITVVEEPLSGLSDSPVEGRESRRLADAEAERDDRIDKHDNVKNAQSPTAERGKDDERGLPTGKTAYRVLFIDGLIGFHGDVQPVAEPEQELERELARPPVSNDISAQENFSSIKTRNDIPEDEFNPHDPDPPGTYSRIYTSAEYKKGIYVERPTEVLGISGSDHVLKLVRISTSTVGLPEIDEGFLQRLMDRHPKGAVWYLSKSGLMQVKDETLVEVDLPKEASRLTSAFKQVRQLMFKPLTDSTSLKRLGACFVWRMKSVPLFTDAVDLELLNAFLHVVESEIARYDAASVSKQQETFVSSVSHELSLSLHSTCTMLLMPLQEPPSTVS
jgi:hypothetical protein